MIFANAKNLWLLLILLGWIGWEYWWQRHNTPVQLGLFGPPLKELMLRHWDEKKSRLKKILFFLALFLVIIALARPQWGKKEEILTAPGMDIVFALDVSKSMLAKDLAPNRLENAKAALKLLSGQLAGNRLALVAFAGSSFIECPLTPDVGAVKLYLESIKVGLIPVPGTDLGGAIATAIQALGETKTSKAIILITDGEDLQGGALAAAAAAAERGIRLYPIGIGTTLGGEVPEVDEDNNVIGIKKDQKGQIVVSKLDVELLKTLAQRTNGQAFFVAAGGSTLPELLAALAALPKSSIKHLLGYEHQDRFQIFLFLAWLCLTAEFLLTERKKI